MSTVFDMLPDFIKVIMKALTSGVVASIFIGVMMIGSVLFVGYHSTLLISDGIVTGTDGGNWLAQASQLTGQSSKASLTVYLPIVPLFLKLCTYLLDDMTALSVVALISFLLPYLIFFIAMKMFTNMLVAAFTTFGLSLSGMSLEILAWGGYPQLLSQGLLTLMMITFARHLWLGDRKWLILGALFGSLCVGTWIPGAFLLAVSLVVYFAYLSQTSPPGEFKTMAIRFLNFAILISLFSLPYIYFYWESREILFLQSWNHQDISRFDAESFLSRVFRGWSLGLISVFTFVLMYSMLMGFIGKKYHQDAKVRYGFGVFVVLLIAPFVLYLSTSELRSLNLIFAGTWGIFGITGYVNGPRSISFMELCIYFKSKVKVVTSTIVVSGCVYLVVATSLIDLKQAPDVFSYYRVLDTQSLQALKWLKENYNGDGRVLETGNHEGFQYIWWLEGYSRTPTISGTDIRYFSFNEEREQSRDASIILYGENVSERTALLQKHKVSWAFIDKNVFLDHSKISELGFSLVFENSKIRIMRSTR